MRQQTPHEFGDAEYRELAEFRRLLRRFLAFSEEESRRAGLEPRQHQALLALRGLPADIRPTVGVLADRLMVRPHTAVALVDRLERDGYVARRPSPDDGREVLVELTPGGETVLRRLTAAHRAELASAGPRVVAVLGRMLARTGRANGSTGARA